VFGQRPGGDEDPLGLDVPSDTVLLETTVRLFPIVLDAGDPHPRMDVGPLVMQLVHERYGDLRLMERGDPPKRLQERDPAAELVEQLGFRPATVRGRAPATSSRPEVQSVRLLTLPTLVEPFGRYAQ
jgi:hypothetical protein